jgi:hypothetical protein
MMKRIRFIVWVVLFLLTLIGCSGNFASSPAQASQLAEAAKGNCSVAPEKAKTMYLQQ